MTEDALDQTLALAQSRVGTTLNSKWSLDRLLGVGGMAAVYEATHRNRKRAAVKVLHREVSANPAVRERFLREGYVANSVRHSGAVAVDDDDVSEDGCAFLVMELLDGETLDARWERKGKHLPPDEVLSLVDQVLSTLDAAHAAGIVHRDLKPENLFLTRAGQVKILDFGIARVREASQTSSKTQTGSMMGTPVFMPPEQARGRWDEVDARSDLWAVGATMFTLLTGRYVHEANTVNEALAFAVTQSARSVTTLVPDLPFPIVELVDRALAYDKGERWPSAETMQTALRRAYAGLQAAALAAGEPALKPITLETFEEQTVALSGDRSEQPRIESALDIPAQALPRVSAGALTTARAVTHGPLEEVLRKGSSSWRIAIAGLAVASAIAGAWLGLRREAPEDNSRASVSATPAPELATAAAVRVDTPAPGPSAVSLHDLPVMAAPRDDVLAKKLRADVEARRTAAALSATPAVSSRPPARPATVRTAAPTDPFAARR